MKKLRAPATIIVILICLSLLQRLLMPKYVDGIIEGRLISEYYEDEYDHDVVFIGDCEVYENFTPNLLWNEYGINSYIRGSAQQLIWQSYYLLEDTLRYEKPEVVIFNVLSMQYNEPQSEAYNRMSIEGMKWSLSKVKNIMASMTKEEHFLDYVFPILRYRSRITDLKPTDIEYMFSSKPVSFNGYYMRVDVKPAENVPKGKILPDYEFGENAYTYLDKIADLCEKEGIELVLIKAPSLYPYWYDEWEVQMENYAENRGLTYINFLELVEECNLDFSKDTYDAGLHLNLSGAEKVSRYLGETLRNMGVPDRRDEEDLRMRWEEKNRVYQAEIQRQTEELNVD